MVAVCKLCNKIKQMDFESHLCMDCANLDRYTMFSLMLKSLQDINALDKDLTAIFDKCTQFDSIIQKYHSLSTKPRFVFDVEQDTRDDIALDYLRNYTPSDMNEILQNYI